MQIADGFLCDMCRIRDKKQVIATKQIEFSGVAESGRVYDHHVVELCEAHYNEGLNTPPDKDEVLHRVTSC